MTIFTEAVVDHPFSLAVTPPFFQVANGFRYNKVCGRVIGYQKGSTDAFDLQESSAS